MPAGRKVLRAEVARMRGRTRVVALQPAFKEG